MQTWKGVHWFIEGDISDWFGSLSHEVLMGILNESIHDHRFLRLIRHMLQAGYLEEWRWHQTLSGAPQGGVCSPILSNIYLDKLDKFVEPVLLPKYNRGKRRAKNPAYQTMENAIARAKRRGDRQAVRVLRKQRRKLPSQHPQDPNCHRLRYVRYADDWVLGFSGPKTEAEEIKRELRDFLRETLKLELSEEKTLITHARTEAAKFLGYHLVSQHVDDKLDRRGQRQVNEMVALRVPKEVIEQKCTLYMQRDKPAQRAALIRDSDYSSGSPVAVGVSRDCSILSARSECGLVQHVALGRRNILVENTCGQTPDNRHEDGEKVPSHHRNGSWAKEMPTSGCPTRRQQKAAGGALRRYSPQATPRGYPG